MSLEKIKSSELQHHIENYQAEKPKSGELLGRKILHYMTGGLIAVNPKLDQLITKVVCLIKDEQISHGETGLVQLSNLAEVKGASKAAKELLQQSIHDLGATTTVNIEAKDVEAKVKAEGYLVINNPHDPVAFALGTFSPISVTFEGIEYSCAETAFQAAKFQDREVRWEFKGKTGAEAQTLSNKLVKSGKKIHPDWNPHNTMKNILTIRTQGNEKARKLLEASGNSYLVVHSSNTYWGDGHGQGENHLGKIMMEVRGEIEKDGKNLTGIVERPQKYHDKLISHTVKTGASDLKNNDIDSLLEVLDHYQLLKKTDSNKAREYIQWTDEKGDTLFHKLISAPGASFQGTILQALEERLGKELVQECFVKLKDVAGKTPLEIAFDRGQMLVVCRAFPLIPNASTWPLTPEEKAHLNEKLQELITVFADPDKRSEHLSKCPVSHSFDRIQHILDGFHNFLCSPQVDEKTKNELLEVISKHQEQLPYELRKYSSLINDPEKFNHHTELCNNCTGENFDHAKADELFNKWNYDPKLIQPATIFSLSILNHGIKGKIEGHGDKTLSFIITQVFEEEDIKKKNGYKNVLTDILNPVGHYNPMDFANPEKVHVDGVPLVQYLINKVLDPETPYDLDQAKEMITRLVLKSPDLLFDKNKEGMDSLTYLNNNLHVDKAEDLKAHLDQLRDDLDVKLLENMTKKGLKFYLDVK